MVLAVVVTVEDILLDLVTKGVLIRSGLQRNMNGRLLMDTAETAQAHN